jgi:hypothetical protein
MKPRLAKPERKAIRFAYDLMCGKLNTYFTFTHGIVLYHHNETWNLRPAGWIEPDQDPERAYLNENTFTHLLILEYFECEYFTSYSKWLYRLSREGCRIMGWSWPNKHPSKQQNQLTPANRRQLQEEFQRRRNRQTLRYQHTRRHYTTYGVPQHRLYHRLHK